MEKDLIKVSEKDGLQYISARSLYEGLQVSHRFNDWFFSLLKYGFQEGEDFTSVQIGTPVNNGAIIKIDDYLLTIEMAKQICMLQRSELGKQYRLYFINLEKAWNSPEAIMARALQVAQKTLSDVQLKLSAAESRLEEQKPKVEAYDNFISRDNFCNFRDGANYLHIKQSYLMNILKSKCIYKNSIGEYRAYGEYSKYFVLRPFDKGYDRTGQ